jgi:putative endonuclease
MYYVYVLKSQKDGAGYIGFTSDVERRVRQHNEGLVTSTRHRIPLELAYYEAYKSNEDARARERSLKLRSRAYTQLKRRISGSLG